jgi:hypothetical protein
VSPVRARKPGVARRPAQVTQLMARRTIHSASGALSDAWLAAHRSSSARHQPRPAAPQDPVSPHSDPTQRTERARCRAVRHCRLHGPARTPDERPPSAPGRHEANLDAGEHPARLPQGLPAAEGGDQTGEWAGHAWNLECDRIVTGRQTPSPSCSVVLHDPVPFTHAADEGLLGSGKPIRGIPSELPQPVTLQTSLPRALRARRCRSCGDLREDTDSAQDRDEARSCKHAQIVWRCAPPARRRTRTVRTRKRTTRTAAPGPFAGETQLV